MEGSLTPTLTPSSVSLVGTRLPAVTSDLEEDNNKSQEMRPRLSTNAPLLPIALKPIEMTNTRVSSFPIPTPKLQRRYCKKPLIIPSLHPEDPYASPCAGVHYIPPVQPPRLPKYVKPTKTDPRPLPPSAQLPELSKTDQRRRFRLRRRPLQALRRGSAFEGYNEFVLPKDV